MGQGAAIACARERAVVSSSLDEAMAESCTGFELISADFRERFFATLAHDMRNPLGLAISSASLIARNPTADRVPQWAAATIDAAKRVNRMIEDLLDVMRIETGRRLQLVLEECDPFALVRSVVESMRARFDDLFRLSSTGWNAAYGTCDTAGTRPWKSRARPRRESDR